MRKQITILTFLPIFTTIAPGKSLDPFDIIHKEFPIEKLQALIDK